MPTMRLNPRSVAALRSDGEQIEYWDDVVPGLALRVGRESKTYIVRYRAAGKHRRLTIGKHPNLTLAAARERARSELQAVAEGADPAEARKARRSHDTTFAALADEVLEAKAATTREKTRRERRRIVDTELVPHWGARPAASITRRDVVQLVEGIANRGAPVMANRVLAAVKMIFNEGIDREFPTLEGSPAARVRPPRDEDGRYRFLERDEIRALWQALAWEAPLARVLFRVALLTAQRIGSVCAMRWADIDDTDVWRIPAESFKGRRPHLVPLSAEALEVLAEMRSLTGKDEHVFPGRADGTRRPHVVSINKMLHRIRERTELPNWNVHDFRTTFRTHATRAQKPEHKRDPAGLGVAPSVADAVLGHKEPSLGFDRYTAEPERYLLSEKREALKRWGAFVTRVVAEGES